MSQQHGLAAQHLTCGYAATPQCDKASLSRSQGAAEQQTGGSTMSTCLHLDHEGLDVAVELCFVVVAGGRQREEVLGCGGREMQTSCASTSVPSSRRLGSSAACIVCDRSPAATASDPPVRGASSQNSSSLMSPRLVCSVTDWGNIRGGGGTGERRQAAAAAAPPTRAEAGGGGCNSRRCDYSSAGCQLQPAQQPLGGGGNASGAP